MRWNVQNWIEEVKRKPEHIRKRYLVACVACSMFFVLIIWSLTITEGLKTARPIETAVEAGNMIPRPSDFSIDEFLSASPDQEAGGRTVQEFLRDEKENRTRFNPDEEGIQPKDETAPPKPEPEMMATPPLNIPVIP